MSMAAAGITIPAFSTAGVVHNSAAGLLSSSLIVNADVAAGAAIVDTKLATISTALKVSNSATTATSANTANAIVARDASGNFAANIITAPIIVGGTGAASSLNLRSTSGAGGVLDTITFDIGNNGSNNVMTLSALGVFINSLGASSIVRTNILGVLATGLIVNADVDAAANIADTKLATISTAGKVSNSATTATSANTASAIVARDGTGAFSAGAIAATGLTVNGAYSLPAVAGTDSYRLTTNGAGATSWLPPFSVAYTDYPAPGGSATALSLLGGFIRLSNNGVSAFAMPGGAALQGAFGAFTVQRGFTCLVVNAGNNTRTIGTAGGTVIPTAITLAAFTSKTFCFLNLASNSWLVYAT
jgi:hypothetical protein